MPLVSIIIPTYNRAHLIRRAISSVMNQTFTDFEIIIVDDFSDDNTEEVINEFASGKIIYIKHTANKGPGATRNTGIKHASGQYIAFLDSDDEWLPTIIDKQVDAFKQDGDELGLVYTAWIQFKKEKMGTLFPRKDIINKEGYIYYDLLVENFIDTPAVMIKKTILKDTGLFDENFKCIEDYDLFLRIAKKYKIKFINEPLLISYETPKGVTGQKLSIHADMLSVILEKYHDDYISDKILLASRYFMIGDLYTLSGEVKKGRRFLYYALKTRPTNIIFLVCFITNILSGLFTIQIYKLVRALIYTIKVFFTGSGRLHFK